jgi:murein DD-endopeptidase MepM/ murein hydrolase activator NlpD
VTRPERHQRSRRGKASACAFGLAWAVVLAQPLTLGASPSADPVLAAVEIDVTARSLQPGELVVLTVGAPADVEGVHVRVFGRDIEPFPVGSGRWRALVGIDLDVKAGPHVVTVDAGQARATRTLQVLPKRFPTRRLTVDPDFVTPPPSATERIERDQQLLAKAWQSSAVTRLWTEPFARPVDEVANSAFGTRSIFNGLPRNAHSGADFLSPAGTPVRAPDGGRILIAQDLYFSGNTIVIDHGLGLFSLLAHLSLIDVREGDRVAVGQVVGKVGATGRVTGPHLHWAVRLNGARVDPLSLLALLGQS